MRLGIYLYVLNIMYDEKNPIINTSALMLEVQLVSYLIISQLFLLWIIYWITLRPK